MLNIQKNNLRAMQLFEFIFTCIAGTLLHFLYEWSGNNIVAAVFSGVNESTWEHMKILFVPMFIYALVEKHLLSEKLCDYWCVKLKGILIGIFMIPFLFYTLNGVFGKTPAWLNIGIFYFSAAYSFIFEYTLFKKQKKCFIGQTMAFAFLCLVALAFLVLTFVQPKLPIFLDPVTLKYGI